MIDVFDGEEHYILSDLGEDGIEPNIMSRTGVGLGLNPIGTIPSGHADLYDGDECSIQVPAKNCFGYDNFYFWQLD